MQKNIFKFLLGLFLNLWLGFNAYAQTVQISLDEALALFYQHNLDLITAQYNIEQARADEIVASAIPNPTFNAQLFSLTKNPNMGTPLSGCNPDPNVSCGIGQNYSFSQLIETAGKRGLRIESSGFATQAAESDFKNALRIFSSMVKEAYFTLLQAQKNDWLAREIVKHYDDVLNVNQLRLKSGDISESDFLRVKMEVMRAQADLNNAQTALVKAQADLAVFFNSTDKNLQIEVKDETVQMPDIGQNLPLETLIKNAIEQRPDLETSKLRIEQTQKELELAKRLKYPDVTVNAGYAYDPSSNNLNSGFVGFSVPVPLFYQYKGEEDKAVANLNKNKLDVAKTENTIRNEVISALATWQSAEKIVQRFNDGILNDALTVRNSSELAYSKGATSVLDFIEAQRNYKNVMRDYYAATITKINAYHNLVKALGVELNAPSAKN